MLGVVKWLLAPWSPVGSARYANAPCSQGTRGYAQLVMRSMLRDYLERVEFADAPFARGFFPIARHPSNRDQKLILVSPFIAFGQPVVRRTGVSTFAIAERVNRGEDAAAVIKDYDLEQNEFDEAIAYEQYAA